VVVALIAVGGLVLSHQQNSEHPQAQGRTPTRVPSIKAPGGVEPGPGGRSLSSLFDTTQPLLPGGRAVTAAEAAALVGYPLYLPQDPQLPAPDVWVVREIGEDGAPFFDAAARYDSSVVVTYATWSAGRDPATVYKQEEADWGVGYVTTIADHPAWVVPAGSKSSTGATVDATVSAVHISIGQTEVALLGKIPVSDLVTYASSLQAALP
jgi:hypothetical protein